MRHYLISTQHYFGKVDIDSSSTQDAICKSCLGDFSSLDADTSKRVLVIIGPAPTISPRLGLAPVASAAGATIITVMEISLINI